jgi:hypothetical protein
VFYGAAYLDWVHVFPIDFCFSWCGRLVDLLHLLFKFHTSLSRTNLIQDQQTAPMMWIHLVIWTMSSFVFSSQAPDLISINQLITDAKICLQVDYITAHHYYRHVFAIKEYTNKKRRIYKYNKRNETWSNEMTGIKKGRQAGITMQLNRN